MIDRIERREAREKLAIECMLLKIEMGIRDLDNRWTTDHTQFISTAEKLTSQVIALVCDFGKIDAEVYPVLSPKFNFPPFEPAPSFTEGYQDMSLGATNFPELGVIYKKANSDLKFFIPTTSMHRLTRKQLEVTLAAVQHSKFTTYEVMFEISRRIKWLEEVKKFWWILIKFLKLHK